MGDWDFEQLLQAEQEFVDSYCVRSLVPGLGMVKQGLEVLFPTTIYQLDGDDTSGVAGILYPDGTFLAAADTNINQLTIGWNSEKIVSVPVNDKGERLVSEASRKEVVGAIYWDGVAKGSLLLGEDGFPHERDADYLSITGEWPDKAPTRGRSITPEKARAEAEEKKNLQCCPLDTDGDGNCPVHESPGVFRRRAA